MCAERGPATLAVMAGILLALAAGCVRRATPPAGPLELRYSCAARESRTWELEQVLRGRVTLGGMPEVLSLKIRGRMTETARIVMPDGRCQLKLEYDFEPISVNGMPVEMKGVQRRSEAFALRSPAGDLEMLEMEKPETDILTWASRNLGGMGPLLPPAPVSSGEKWDRLQKLALGRDGQLDIATMGVLRGVEDRDGRRCAILAMEGGANLAAPMPDPGLEFLRLEYTGFVHFALDEGAVYESRQEGTLAVKAKTRGGSMEGRFAFTSVLKRTAVSATVPAEPGEAPANPASP